MGVAGIGVGSGVAADWQALSNINPTVSAPTQHSQGNAFLDFFIMHSPFKKMGIESGGQSNYCVFHTVAVFGPKLPP